MKKYPNLIRGFDFNNHNMLWVSDITYIHVNNEFAYLSLTTDAYSHEIVGYELNLTLESRGSIKALQMAINGTSGFHKRGLIHHSDRGSQVLLQRIYRPVEKQQYPYQHDREWGSL